MNNIEQLKSLVATAELEATKFEKGNKTAGTRLRKAAMEIAKLCKVIRTEVSEKKNEQ